VQEELGKERPGKASDGRKGSKWTRMEWVRCEEEREEPHLSNTHSCLPGRAWFVQISPPSHDAAP